MYLRPTSACSCLACVQQFATSRFIHRSLFTHSLPNYGFLLRICKRLQRSLAFLQTIFFCSAQIFVFLIRSLQVDEMEWSSCDTDIVGHRYDFEVRYSRLDTCRARSQLLLFFCVPHKIKCSTKMDRCVPGKIAAKNLYIFCVVTS